MTTNEIVSTIMVSILLIALLVLAYMICIKLAEVEKQERQQRTKLYKEMTRYFNMKNEKEKAEREKENA